MTAETPDDGTPCTPRTGSTVVDPAARTPVWAPVPLRVSRSRLAGSAWYPPGMEAGAASAGTGPPVLGAAGAGAASADTAPVTTTSAPTSAPIHDRRPRSMLSPRADVPARRH